MSAEWIVTLIWCAAWIVGGIVVNRRISVIRKETP